MVRIVEGKLPYTGGTGIGIDTNKVIGLLLREENNLIMVNGDNEIYTDLQLAVNITPSSDFPVGVTVGKVLAEDGWSQNGLILNWKTTSGDYARWLYGADGEIYFDGGQGTWKQVYYSQEVDALFTALRGELATVAFTGDYNDLINRPAFLQIQADWDQTDTDAPDYIKNKPTIPVVNDATLTIQKNGTPIATFTANSSTAATANITVPNVINNVTSTSTGDALSANQGKLLQDQIDDLKAMGRFLSLWDCETGLPISFPLSTPYNYQTGDYFLVENVDTTTNYRPSGVQYTGTASSTVETDEVEVGDLYIYDGSVWLLQINHGKSVSFANLAGQPSDNTALASALNAKQDSLTLPSSPTSGHLVTWGADNKTLADGGAVPTVPTNVSAFTNDAGYITSGSLAGNATANTAGIVKLGSDTAQTVAANTVSSTADRTYAVQTNTSGQMLVNVPWEDAKVKYFYIHNPVMYQQDAIADVQAIWDWQHAGSGRGIVAECIDGFLTHVGYDVGTYVFTLTGRGYGPEDGGSNSTMTYVTLTCPTDGNGVVQSVTYTAASYPYLSTNYDYFTPYTPLYNGSPATKKYVDDNAFTATTGGVKVFDLPSVGDDISDIMSWISGGGNVVLVSAPVNGVRNYYRVYRHSTNAAGDTIFAYFENTQKAIAADQLHEVISITNMTYSWFEPSNAGTQGQVLTKGASGYGWAAPSGGDVMVSSQANNILTSGMKIWAGTQANYEGLGTYDSNCLYLTIE